MDETTDCQPADPGSFPFLQQGHARLASLAGEIEDLQDLLLDVQALEAAGGRSQTGRLLKELEDFKPSVTMIGQIKSGKTSLVNAMVARPGLLPADVNPWTSVVTSLNLNAPRKDGDPVASFQFFNGDEWDHLVSSGGRIGELSMRAGADEELQKIQAQVAEMREKTRKRLGRRFELLLGQKHDYRHLDDDLMQRYVCLGDDFEMAGSSDQQGRFADITKSADLFLPLPSLPVPLCLRDTPGVNDTFLMREQITIKSLRNSRLCVVVLSASQALSSVDMGLIRMISNVRSEGIVIFVNRIDELPDPVNQIPDIRDSILATLEKMNGPENPRIVFGSALWANAALAPETYPLCHDSAASLRQYAGPDALAGPEQMWQLSGVPELFETIGARLAEGAGARLLSETRQRAANQVSSMKTACTVASMRIDGNRISVIEPAALSQLLGRLETISMAQMDTALDQVFAAFSARVDQAHNKFLERAVASLLQHLENYGENETWQYAPDGLRILLRSSYQVMRKNLLAACTQVYSDAASAIFDTYQQAVSIQVSDFRIAPAAVPEVPPPVAIGATIALDLQTSWWKSWWKRRRGYRAYASGFYDLIKAETAPIVQELKEQQAAEIRQDARERLMAFFTEQRALLMDVAEKTRISVNDLNNLFGITAQQEQAELLDLLLKELAPDGAKQTDEPAQAARKGAAA
ncbi:dynamin family protein [Leisingera sp. S232]|uniref:dynamin family protein n=1 Tax=Leisingera sp. S232 TaxID=3415132 RepID=UPI003C7E7DE1